MLVCVNLETLSFYVLRQRHYYFSPGADPKFDPGGRGVDPDDV